MKSRMILLLALIMSVVTTFLFLNNINQTEVENVKEEEKIEVVVANQTIKANQSITAEMVGIKEVSINDVHPSTVTSLEEIENMFAITTIEENEIILTHRLKNNEEEKQFVSRKITNGYRAVSIGINVVQSVSNLIQPEDYVDVLYTGVATDESATANTVPLLTNVRVLAIGQKLTTAADAPEPSSEYSSITLELQPNDVTKLVNASENGSIHLSLHSSIIQVED